MGTYIPSQHEPYPRTRSDDEKITNGATRRLPDLPVELHKLIIDELEGETEALKQCALTCRVYRHLAQKHLLKSVMLLSRMTRNPTVEEFVAFLEASPQIAKHIERLVISGETKLIAQAMRPLINVVDVVLRGCGSFARFEPASQLAVMLKCESLVSLTLQSIKDVPLKVFDHLRRLERLTLEEVRFVNDPRVRLTPEPSCRPRIKEMKLVGDASIAGIGSIYNFLEGRGFGLNSLETLSIVMNSHSYLPLSNADYGAIAPRYHNNNKWYSTFFIPNPSLRATYDTTSLPDDEQLDFDVSTLPLPLLEELSLGGVLSWHLETFKTIPRGRKFKSITLKPVIIDLRWIEYDYLDYEGLKYLETLIVENLLPRTESFSFEFTLNNNDEDDMCFVREEIQYCFLTLHSLNFLKFIGEMDMITECRGNHQKVSAGTLLL
ncbi:hypothetical protein D9613_008799 [Agrocybe pediades]|uniref:F-box domain-containing protein n=1 Tax=Agrocybe pediades TaxID=84607 RepID=A0A8H4QSP2_9AGAR|nr:hypothetical protein D9613_008799 [Agrocybe pediades]